MTKAARLGSSLARRKAVTAWSSAALVAGMVGLSFAAVPLYRWFCLATGWDGTPGRAIAAPGAVGDRVFTVRFDGDVFPGLPWTFGPEKRQMRVLVGQETLAFFRAQNDAAIPITGSATFNVTPEQAGRYVSKIACFCFSEQRLEPGQVVDMPVSFFIDPDIAADKDLKNLDAVTLHYTFFRAKSDGGTATSALDLSRYALSSTFNETTSGPLTAARE